MRILNSPILFLFVLAAFLALALYSHKAAPKRTGDLGAFVAAQLAAYNPPARPVVIKQPDRRAECGEDWACLVAWAAERKAGKHGRI